MEDLGVLDIVEKHRDSRGGLISILEEVQARYGYLTEKALRDVARETGRPFVDIFGVATFYKSFSLRPRGKHLTSVCLGTACHVRNSPMIAEEFSRQLQVGSGETTSDGEFTLETVNCLGACALGPIVVVDGHYFSKVVPSKVKQILRKARKGLDQDGMAPGKHSFAIEVSCPRCNHGLSDARHPIDSQPSVRLTASFGHEHGWLRLSSLYGSSNLESEHEIPKGTVVHCFCPHCHAELVGASNCVECDAPMVPMIVRAGGMVQICSRRGCRTHMLDLDGENL